MRSSGLRLALILLLAGGAVAAVTYLNRAKSGSGELVQEVKRDRTPVRVLRLAPVDATESLEHTGALEAERDITVTAEVGGRIKRKLKRMGDRCRKGEAIFTLDAEAYRIARAEAAAQLRQSQLQRTQAERDHHRTEQLARRKVVAGEALDRAETALKTSAATVARAEAALQLARRNLRETQVRCPFDGTVAETMVDDGQVIAPQMSLARLVDVGQLKLRVKVSAAELARLRVGQGVRLFDPSLPAADQVRFAGTIARLGVAADPSTRTFPVEVTVPGSAAEGRLTAAGPRPGQVVRSTIAIAQHRGVLMVPESAVSGGDGGGDGGDGGGETSEGRKTVAVVVGGKVARRAVTLGARIGSQVIITAGLAAGDQVIVAGHHGLKPGDAVEAVAAERDESDETARPAQAAPQATAR